MFPLPKSSSGWYLHHLFEISLDEYLAIDRRNLIEMWPGSEAERTGTLARGSSGDVFPIHEARARAALITPTLAGRYVLFMGRGVAGAFGKGGRVEAGEHQQPDILEWNVDAKNLYEYAIFPHTSRVSRWWNTPANRKRARAFLKLTYQERFYKK